MSALETSVVPLIRRVTLEALCSRLWRSPVFSRRSLPEPVTRNLSSKETEEDEEEPLADGEGATAEDGGDPNDGV